MKTKKLAYAVFLVLGAVFSASAQDYAFKVLVNKGKNEVKAGPNWQPVKVGASLKSSDELKVTANSYVGLVHVSGKPLELKDAKTYKVADLAGMVGTGPSVLNKYTDFILSKNTDKKNHLAATGAVHRGTEFPLYLPVTAQKAVIFNDEVIVDWDFGNPKETYVVLLSSMFGDELLKKETTESQLKINLSDPLLANEDNIIVKVQIKGSNKTTAEYTLKRLSKADKDRIKSAYEEFSRELTEENALKKFFLVGFFEQNGLLIDATTAYLEAIKLEPSYKEGYNDFLERNGLKDAPSKGK